MAESTTTTTTMNGNGNGSGHYRDAETTAVETPIESLPDDIQTYISELRDEAAKHRTAKNSEAARAEELETKYNEAGKLLQDANSKLESADEVTDAHEKLLAEHEDTKFQLLRTQVAARYGIADHVHRIQGSSEEELDADAANLAQLVHAKSAPSIPVDTAAAEPPTPLTDTDELSKSFRSALGL